VSISIIIPVAVGDLSFKSLIEDLSFLDTSDEIIIVSPENISNVLASSNKKIEWINSEAGRGIQLNTGAKFAKNEFLWFLHCDSRVKKTAYEKLKKCISKDPLHLYYFDLNFLSDGPSLMILNELGVFVRSRFLKMPFGDQGFCIRKDLFFKLGTFDEKCLYGEDHLFAWQSRINGIPLQSVKESISTSARKYKLHGWGKVTIIHLIKTYQQAIPQFIRLLKNKGKKI
jgi:hypothetical protein